MEKRASDPSASSKVKKTVETETLPPGLAELSTIKGVLDAVSDVLVCTAASRASIIATNILILESLPTHSSSTANELETFSFALAREAQPLLVKFDVSHGFSTNRQST